MEEDVIARHRKEKKELQAKIQALKKSVPKGDRSRKTAVQQEIEKLEKELTTRQASELASLSDSLETCTISSAPVPNGEAAQPEENQTQQPRVSKAAKRREKAAAKARSLAAAVESGNVKYATSSSAVEFSKVNAVLAKRGLIPHKVPSDGDCLFAALVHQLDQRDLKSRLIEAAGKLNVSTPADDDSKSLIRCLRYIATAYIREHGDDFFPFICAEGFESVDDYCLKMESSGTWGGQLEIRAISMALSLPIDVLQAEGPAIQTGEEFTEKPLVITYHQHAFTTGAHYNSCLPSSNA